MLQDESEDEYSSEDASDEDFEEELDSDESSGLIWFCTQGSIVKLLPSNAKLLIQRARANLYFIFSFLLRKIIGIKKNAYPELNTASPNHKKGLTNTLMRPSNPERGANNP